MVMITSSVLVTLLLCLGGASAADDDGRMVRRNERQLESLDPRSVQLKDPTTYCPPPTLDLLCDYQWEMKGPEAHYDDSYFKWQKEIGAHNGAMFADNFRTVYNLDGLVVADIGCGGGYALSAMAEASTRYCFEINPAAIAEHPANVISVPRWSEMPSDSVDLMYSHHSFEHHPHPLLSLQCAITKLKPRGILHLYVPFEHTVS